MDKRKTEAFGRLLDVLDELRVKCPWDREQTMESLRNCTIEETYELADAIAEGDYDGIRQELGDVLLHVVFYAKIADEEGRFDIADVIDFLCDKLIYRHPHVFGTVDADNSVEVKYNWEQLKLKEKKRRKGILGGVPQSLPAMVKAYRVGEKAASAGFDWEKKEDVWDKVREELAETEAEIRALEGAGGDAARLEEEFGDLFFSLVNAARLYGVDPEMALERCNKKFIDRFGYVERKADQAGKPVREYPLDRLEAWWQEAKTAGKQ
ncbi:MAG: nucleoside triphosphate pyrophosphohydrolase [Rikenellaceae bacterium]|nr:nucleoside triphosphate pyrophosphohydrolase [Rikenellaceae bacterium]